MASPRQPTDEVDVLLRNAQLRNELEPFLDESIDLLDRHVISTPAENEYLESMLEWERAPVLPISRWFQPELRLPSPDTLADPQLHEELQQVIQRLYEKQIALHFTDHLSDRELYCLIFRDILSSFEKKLERSRSYLHWHCLDINEDPETWLRYYATDEERDVYARSTGQPIPPAQLPPNQRLMPWHQP